MSGSSCNSSMTWQSVVRWVVRYIRFFFPGVGGVLFYSSLVMGLPVDILRDGEVGWLFCQLQEDWLMDMGVLAKLKAMWRVRKASVDEWQVDGDAVVEVPCDVGEMLRSLEQKLEETRKVVQVGRDVELYRWVRSQGKPVGDVRVLFERVRERDLAEFEHTGRFVFGELFGSSGSFRRYCRKWCGEGDGDRLKLLDRLQVR